MAQLIVFEGIDGSGKTSLSRLFNSHLKEKGLPTAWLREPSDSALGDKIRRIAQDNDQISPQQELEYFIQDRRWDVVNNILPALQAGKTVVLDRYFYSNACYQGARGLDMEAIIRLNLEFAPAPDLTFVIDVDVDRALARINRSRQGVVKLFEKKEFLKKVRANYLKLSGADILPIDGNPDLETVLADIISRFDARTAAQVPAATKP
jgi:dTMP kinase